MASQIADMFKDGKSGKISAQRVLALAWGLGVLIIWGYMTIHSGAMAALPDQIVWITLGMAGLKVVQRYGEGGKPLSMELDKGTKPVQVQATTPTPTPQ